MALLIFISSSGLSLDVHFCQGKFKRANIFGKAKTCQEIKDCLIKCGKQVKSCHFETTCDKDGTHKECCSNERFELDLDLDSSEIIYAKIGKIQKQFLAANPYRYILNIVPSKDVSKFRLYKPPPLEKDFEVDFQVFRL